jgi:hypothetical protein
MNVSLMPGVPNNRILGRPKDAMQSDGQLHDTQIWTKVSADSRYTLDETCEDFISQLRKLLRGQGSKITRIANAVQQGHGVLPEAGRLDCSV